jgi:hypothetical protein
MDNAEHQLGTEEIRRKLLELGTGYPAPDYDCVHCGKSYEDDWPILLLKLAVAMMDEDTLELMYSSLLRPRFDGPGAYPWAVNLGILKELSDEAWSEERKAERLKDQNREAGEGEQGP